MTDREKEIGETATDYMVVYEDGVPVHSGEGIDEPTFKTLPTETAETGDPSGGGEGDTLGVADGSEYDPDED